MDIREAIGAPVDGIEGPNAKTAIRWVTSIDDPSDAVSVLAVQLVSLARAFDRAVSGTGAASTIPALSKNMRETAAEIRSLTTVSADDPFAVAQRAALEAVAAETPSLFSPGPAA